MRFTQARQGHARKVTTTAKEALAWTTVNAADALGLGDRIGSLTPGKRADLQLVGGGAVEQHPRIDPYATLLFQTTAADVRTVLVDGRVADAGRALPGTPPGAFEALEPVAASFHDEAMRAAKAGPRQHS